MTPFDMEGLHPIRVLGSGVIGHAMAGESHGEEGSAEI
jgi:hypothetical protein